MRIDLTRPQIDTLTGSLTVDILTAIDSRKAAGSQEEYTYWTNLIQELKTVRDTINKQTTIDMEPDTVRGQSTTYPPPVDKAVDNSVKV